MSVGTGRQTYMVLEALSHQVEAKARRALRLMLWIAFAFVVFFVMLTPLVWTSLTKPNVYAMTPSGETVRLQIKTENKTDSQPQPRPQPQPATGPAGSAAEVGSQTQ